MTLTPARILVVISCLFLTATPALLGQCPVNSLVVKGRVEHPPRNASVRVLLFYPPDAHKKYPSSTGMENNDRPGESAEAILDGDTFTIPIEFLTNDRRTVMTFDPHCSRKPRTVVVTLKRNDNSGSNDSDEYYDRVTLDFPRDFKSDDSQHYTLRSDLVLNREQP